MSAILPPVLFALLVLASVTYSQAGDPPAAPNLSGSWPEGYWKGEQTGHRGPLRATFCKLDESHYRVTFRGRFFAVIPFRYSVTLDVTGVQGDKVLLSGTSQIPIFGLFEYHAEATGRDFVATFQSRNDNGVFVLKRCD